jgi:DNA-binding response OmpR family regulator
MPADTVQAMIPAHRILLVEDDERIGGSLHRALNATGYDAVWVTTIAAALSLTQPTPSSGHAERPRFDLILLDLGLPDGDGLDLCRQITGFDPLVPVIMLTARDEEPDIVVGLDAGAIDYIVKPFNLSPLLARIRAQLRRMDVEQRENTTVLTVGALHIDSQKRRVTLANHVIVLRAKEFDLLARLAATPGVVVTRETLMCDVWDEHWSGSTKTLDFHIAALRSKLDASPRPSSISPAQSWITTIRGVGFFFDAPAD